jgi:hypothetical protein
MMSSILDDASQPKLHSCSKGNTRLQREADALNMHCYGAQADEAEEMEFREAAMGLLAGRLKLIRQLCGSGQRLFGCFVPPYKWG